MSTPNQMKAALLAYMQVKIEMEDWHGVADVANDLRELDVRFPELKIKTPVG